MSNGLKRPWTGPLESDTDEHGKLLHPVPFERWPYGPPESHEQCCALFIGILHCDCKASDASDSEFGEAHET